MLLYKHAWLLHFKETVKHVSAPGDTLYVIAGSLRTNNRRDVIRDAMVEVCLDSGRDRTIVPCIWDAPTSWGIQVADYGLWAVQRRLECRPCKWFDDCVRPTLATQRFPWGK